MTSKPLSKRDKFLLVFIIILGLGFLYYNYLLNPTLGKINELKESYSGKESTLKTNRLMAGSIDSVLSQQSDVIVKIDESTAKYYPHMEAQYFVDLVIDKVKAQNMTVVGIEAAAVAAYELRSETVKPEDNALKNALKGLEPQSEPAPSPSPDGKTEAPKKYYIGRTDVLVTFTGGKYGAVADFLGSLDALEMPVYCLEVNLYANNDDSLDAQFYISFLSIERTDVVKYEQDVSKYKYETLPESLTSDPFLYPVPSASPGA